MNAGYGLMGNPADDTDYEKEMYLQLAVEMQQEIDKEIFASIFKEVGKEYMEMLV